MQTQHTYEYKGRTYTIKVDTYGADQNLGYSVSIYDSDGTKLCSQSSSFKYEDGLVPLTIGKRKVREYADGKE